MQNVYFYDSEGYFTYFDVITEGQAVPSNATTIVPEGLKPRFDGSKWVPMSREDYDKMNPPMHPATPTAPDQSTQAMNALGLQVAQLTKQNQQLSQAVNALGLQLAQFEKGGK